MQFSKNNKVLSAITPTAGAAGTTDIEGTVIDTQGFQGVAFLVRMGAITTAAVTSLKAKQGDLADGSDADDIEGSAQAVAVADAGEVFIIDILRPTKRYVRLIADRGTANAVVASAEAILYGPSDAPVTQPAGVNAEALVSPAEGTA
jgi:hypothetical protein